MKLNKIFLILLVVFMVTFTVSVVSAENVKFAGHSFEVPKGFSVNATSDSSVKLVEKNNPNYVIFISEDNNTDLNLSKASRQSVGFNLISESNFTSSKNIIVNQQNFAKNESYFSYYMFNVSGDSFLLTYSFPVHDEKDVGKENPVTTIIDSFQ